MRKVVHLTLCFEEKIWEIAFLNKMFKWNLTHTWIYQKILPQVPFIRVFWLWFVDLPAFHGSTQQGQVDEKLIEGGFKDRPLSDHLDPPQKMTSAVACERYHFTCIFEIHWAYRWPSTGREEILVECTPPPKKNDVRHQIFNILQCHVLDFKGIFYFLSKVYIMPKCTVKNRHFHVTCCTFLKQTKDHQPGQPWIGSRKGLDDMVIFMFNMQLGGGWKNIFYF